MTKCNTDQTEFRNGTLISVYKTFYLPDWPWHLLIISIVAGILVLYTDLLGSLRRLASLVFKGVPFSELVSEGIMLAMIITGIILLSAARRGLLRYVLQTRVLNRVQPLLVKRMTSFPLDYFTKRSPGDLLSVISSVAVSAINGILMTVEPLLIVLQVLYLVLLMFSINLPLTLYILSLLAAYLIILQILRSRQARLFERTVGSRRALGTITGDAHRGFLEIKQNALESVFEDRFAAASKTHWDNFSDWLKTLLVSDVTSEYMGMFLPALVLFVAALPALAGHVDGTTFILLYTLAVMLAGLLTSLNQMGFSSASGFRAWGDVMEIVHGKSERHGGDKPQGYHIEWKDVTKCMRGNTVLNKVTLTISEGEKVMICGLSGDGKSTILKMLPGLLEPDIGTACVGGVSTREADPAALRALTVFVPQDPYLFETTLRENLSYNRAVDDSELKRALQLVQLDEFVATLPDSLDARLGPDGVKVSGGEKARIALARAILRRPNILILDEATASLDSETEERIYRYLLSVKRTVVGVTHRLSTLKLFPRIVALVDGRIALDGPTDEVIASPVFQELFAFQMETEVAQ